MVVDNDGGDDLPWYSRDVTFGTSMPLLYWLATDSLAAPAARRAAMDVLDEVSRLRAALGHSTRGVALLDARGALVGFNQAFCRLLGGRPSFAHGLERVLGEAERELLELFLRSSAGDVGFTTGVFTIRNMAGREIELVVGPLSDDRGSPFGHVVTAEDRSRHASDDARRRLIERANLETMARLCERPPRPSTSRSELRANVDAATKTAMRWAISGSARRRVVAQADVSPELEADIEETALLQILVNTLSTAVELAETKEQFGLVTVTTETNEHEVTIHVRQDAEAQFDAQGDVRLRISVALAGESGGALTAEGGSVSIRLRRALIGRHQ